MVAKKASLTGLLVLIVGPSGSGKGTVIAELRKRHPDWVFPISATTREKRPAEVSGEVYYFMSKEDFKKGIEDGDFLEWAEVHKENFYGTMKKPILEALEAGKVVIREVDIQGFKSIRQQVPKENLISMFFMVPDLDELIARILKRGKLPDDEIKRRMESAKKEISQAGECDYRVPSPTGKIAEITDGVEKIILKHYWGVAKW